MNELTWILSSSVLILAVILIRALFGKRMRPGLRCALWGLVLLRLLWPGTVWSSPVSVQSVAGQTEVVQNYEALRNLGTIEYRTNGSVGGYYRDPFMTGHPVTVAAKVTPERFERMRTTVQIRDVLAPAWHVGIAAMALVFLGSNLCFYGRLRKNRRRLEADCPLRVYTVEGLDSSCLFGNAIYVTDGAEREELSYILAHEMSHYRHGDPLWSLLRCVVLALHWYNPLVWWAAYLARRDGELWADAGALARLGEDKREAYGRTLIRLSAGKNRSGTLLHAAAPISGGRRELKERISMIAKKPRMTAGVLIAVLCLAALAAGCAFTGTAAENGPGKEDILEATPVSGSVLGGAELEYFNDVFFNIEGEEDGISPAFLRLQFLGSLYERPEDIDLFELFYNGARQGEGPMSPEEEEQVGSDLCPTTKISADTMDEVFYENTGLHLDETEKVNLNHFTYLAEYDAYYHMHGDTNQRGPVEIVSGIREDDLVHLYYKDDFYEGEWRCVTLRDAGEGRWHFVSNLQVLDWSPELPVIYPEGDPWKVLSLKDVPWNIQPEEVDMVTRVNDCAERMGGWLVGENGDITVRTYRSTDGNIYAAVVDEEVAQEDGSIDWTVRTFYTFPEEAQVDEYNSMFYFDDLFGADGLCLCWFEPPDEDGIELRHYLYYAFRNDGTALRLAECVSTSEPVQWDLDGDGCEELVSVGPWIAEINYLWDGKVYRANVTSLLGDELGQKVGLKPLGFDKNYRCLRLETVPPPDSEDLPEELSVYFDCWNQQLLVYQESEEGS